jgi:hypothetical protein
MQPNALKSWRTGLIKTERVKPELLCLYFVLLASCCLAQAQTSGQTSMSNPPSGLKTLGFGFEKKAFTRLVVTQVNTNNTTIPTEPYAYRAELGNVPHPGNNYYQYERQPAKSDYAVLQVRNEGTKTIESVDWEFTFPRFKGNKEMVYYQTSSRIKIAPNQVATLSKKLTTDDCASRIVHALGTVYIGRVCGRKNRKSTGMYAAEGRIKQVRYTDGTVWTATP